MDDYEEIKELLRPRRDIRASDGLRRKVIRAIDRERANRAAKKWLLGGAGISAVAALLLIMFIPSGISAQEILSRAIDVLRNAESVEMVVEVRTRPIENFRFIDINDNFVRHHIRIANTDSLQRWRIDKVERVATGCGDDIYTWIPSLNLGWHIKGSDAGSVLGYMATLLNPAEILNAELDNGINKHDDFQVVRKGNETIITIHAGLRGDFDNPYLLNTSIEESESVRKYVFATDTKRLKSVIISVVTNGCEYVVLKVSDIRYGNHPGNIPVIPDSIRFVEFDNQPDGLKGLNAEEAASTFLNAFAEWDEKIIDKMINREMQDVFYREYFHGARLEKIGRAFTSGLGESVFVPYALILRDGSVHSHNIALQKTDCGGWVVVGGL